MTVAGSEAEPSLSGPLGFAPGSPASSLYAFAGARGEVPMLDRGRKSLGAQPCRDPLRDVDGAVPAARTAECDRDIGFSFLAVEREKEKQKLLDPRHGLGIGRIAGDMRADRIVHPGQVAEIVLPIGISKESQ